VVIRSEQWAGLQQHAVVDQKAADVVGPLPSLGNRPIGLLLERHNRIGIEAPALRADLFRAIGLAQTLVDGLIGLLFGCFIC
jgi:hypothetical protein